MIETSGQVQVAIWKAMASVRTAATCLLIGVVILHLTGLIHCQEELQYCPFYNNRGPSPQPFLDNCTWYRDNACCKQEEITYGFANVKPPQGASDRCLRQLNYLTCYVCAPTQYKFYINEYLYVCSEFCDNFYDACKDAILKGSVISNLYENGRQFCESRRFKVGDRSEDKCFYFSEDLVSNSARSLNSQYIIDILLQLLTAVLLLTWGNQYNS
mgnify:CR=1 FL=1